MSGLVPKPPGHARWLAGIAGVAVVLRVGAALYLDGGTLTMPGIADQLSYHTLAVRVSDGHGFSFGTGWWPATPAGRPTAHWSYLYVLFVAAIYQIAGPVPLAVRLIQAVLVGILQPVLTYRITGRLFGPRVALISAVIAGGYAYFVYYAGALMTESLFIVALLWSVDVAFRIGLATKRLLPAHPGLWLQLGLALLTAVLLRQAAVLLVPLLLGWAAWRDVSLGRVAASTRAASQALAGVTLALVVLAAGILPWTVRNFYAFDEFVLLNTNAGFAFYWGNHPVHGTEFVPILPEGQYRRLLPMELRGLNEASLDKALLARGVAFVVADPGRYVRLSASRLKEYVRFWPSERSGLFSTVVRLLSFGLCLPLFLFGIILALTRPALPSLDGTPGVWLLLTCVVVYSLIHLLTWTLVRYRVPVDALLMPFGALSVAWSWEQCRSPRRLRHSLVTAD